MKIILSANVNNLLLISDKFIVSIGKEFYDKFISEKGTVPSSKKHNDSLKKEILTGRNIC